MYSLDILKSTFKNILFLQLKQENENTIFWIKTTVKWKKYTYMQDISAVIFIV